MPLLNLVFSPVPSAQKLLKDDAVSASPALCRAQRSTVVARTLVSAAVFLLVVTAGSGMQARAAVTKDASVSYDQNSASTSVTTPALTTKAANELLLAFISTDSVGSRNVTVKSVTGGGLTWVFVGRTNTQPGDSEIWRAFAPSPVSAVSVTANLSQSVASSMTVQSYTGVDTTGTNGSGAIGAVVSSNSSQGAPAANLVTTKADSLVVGVGNDYTNAISRTPLSGQSIIHQSLSSTGDTYWVQQVNAETANQGSQIKLGDSAPTTDQYNLAVCEILASSAVAGPQISLSSSSLSFGSVVDGTSHALSLTLTSSGTSSVTVSSIATTGTGYALGTVKLPSVLSPGQTLTVPVAFDPATSGTLAGSLSIVSNSAVGATTAVPLSGTGVAATRQLGLSASVLPFGNVADGSTKSLSLTLSSTGNSSVNVSSLSASGTGFALPAESLPLTLAPGQSLVVPVTFTPKTAGSDTGALTIGSNSTNGTSTSVSLSGAGVAPLSTLSVSATSLPFGSVVDGTSKSLSLTLSSTGTAAVTVNAASVSGTGFSTVTSGLPTTLNPGQSLTLAITFAPKSTGTDAGTLTIGSNSSTGATTTVSLSGTGSATANPILTLSAPSISFGNVTDGSSTTGTVKLSSTGTSALTVSSAAVSGTGFSLVGGAFPLTINAGASATLTVQFAPTAVASETGQLVISSNSTTGSTSTVALSGTGEAPVVHTVDLTWAAPTGSTDPVAGYHIYRAVSGGSFTMVTTSLDATTSYADNTVASGTTYLYEVKSVDSSGMESTASNQFTTTIP